MATPAQLKALKHYARAVREARRAHAEITEPGLAPRFQRLLEDLLPLLPAAPLLTIVAEFINPGVGRPDLALKRAGQPARAFVELKGLEKSTDGASWKPGTHDGRQFARFSELPHWAISNFHEVRLYNRGDNVGYAALLPPAALDPTRSDAAA
ncbi:MAG: hypothetical protein JOZ27_05045, partial [Caulobacteraceae bacterium]|nr:hypothetical protein [Caulobacteraceae bacterium]